MLGLLYPERKKQHRTSGDRTNQQKLLLCIVGLPGRGKSYTATKLAAYLKWKGIPTQIFNCDELVVKVDGTFLSSLDTLDKEKYILIANEVLTRALEWMATSKGQVAIFVPPAMDHVQRLKIVNKCRGSIRVGEVNIIFVENICTDPYVLTENFRQKIINSSIYSSMGAEEAIKDIKQKIRDYETIYTPVQDDSLSYIKIINLKTKVVSNRVYGSLPQSISSFLMSIHTQSRPLWFTKPAEWVYTSPEEEGNERKREYEQKTQFTEKGLEYIPRLAEFTRKRCPRNARDTLLIFTGTKQRVVDTAKLVKPYHKFILLGTLNALDAGICTGMSLEGIQTKHPQIWSQWKEDRYRYRFPGGESYVDLVQRLEAFVLDLERLTCPVLVVGHHTVLQVLYCYFRNVNIEEAPRINIPKHTVIEIVSTRSGWVEKHYKLVPDEK